MAVETTAKPNGLKTVWDVIVAPKDALESLRVAPTWGWALLIVLVLTTLSVYLCTPASVHGMTTDWPNMVAKSPQLAAQTPEQQQAGLALGTKIAELVWVFTPIFILIAALIGTVILVIFNAIGRGSGTFGQYWAAQWTISIVSAVGSIVLAVIVLVRGADSFNTAASVQSAMPSLAMLVPASAVKLHAFLGVFTVFGIWAAGLEIAALSVIGRVSTVPAWLGGSLTLIVGGLFAAAFAR
jgi:hypothetical protein